MCVGGGGCWLPRHVEGERGALSSQLGSETAAVNGRCQDNLEGMSGQLGCGVRQFLMFRDEIRA